MVTFQMTTSMMNDNYLVSFERFEHKQYTKQDIVPKVKCNLIFVPDLYLSLVQKIIDMTLSNLIIKGLFEELSSFDMIIILN